MATGHVCRWLSFALALAALTSLPIGGHELGALAGGMAQAKTEKKDESLPSPNRSGITSSW